MNAPVVTFFNNKGGVGKTTLVYHVAWMSAFRGHRVVAADLDPQSNLTAAFFAPEEIEQFWSDSGPGKTVWGAVAPLHSGTGDINPTPPLQAIAAMPDVRGEISLLPGDLGLSQFEDDLSGEWPKCLDANERSFRVISSFARVIAGAASERQADVVFVDVGPNLGAINRAALVASDYVVVPLAPDLFSLQGLRNLGPALRRWRGEWKDRLAKRPATIGGLRLPMGEMDPVGYVMLQHGIRKGRPVHAYQRWMDKIPLEYRQAGLSADESAPETVETDPECLAQLKHYHSLIPLGQEASKPIFALKSADGVFGGHVRAVSDAYDDFARLTRTILDRVGVPV